MDRGTWQAIVQRIAKQTDKTERLHFHFSLSCIAEGNGNPFQCSCLENPRDGGDWWAAVYGITQNWTQLSDLAAAATHVSKIILKILQARLQQYMNRELPDVQAGFRKGRETRNQIANICWIIKKVREFQKNIYFCFIEYTKAFDCVDHNKLLKILKEMGIPDHLTCLLRNLCTGQGATVRTGYGTADWFQIGRGVRQGCILSPCLFNLYAEYIMRNSVLDEAHLESRLL